MWQHKIVTQHNWKCPKRESSLQNLPSMPKYVSTFPRDVGVDPGGFWIWGIYDQWPVFVLVNPVLLTLWGLGTWNFTSPRDWALFGDFYLFLLNQSFICHGSQFSSLFTIHQEHMSLWPQCNILFCTTTFMML